ncbi:MerR family DNA-binding transcriptional regulator, partial [Microbacterium sp. B19]
MSAATGVTAHTLRYYERAGLIQPVARSFRKRTALLRRRR